MVFKNQTWVLVALISVIVGVTMNLNGVMSRPYRILLDTDVDTDDFFALLYLLKLNRSEFDLKGVTINSNGWTNAGHAVNHVYDMLYMMGRDDIPVGVGGEGGITQDGTILPNVGGFLPLIEQGMTTSGYCRYRQAIPVGPRGKLDIDTNFGIRKAFLPQGTRRYIPLEQPTVQQVMMDVISQGPTTVFLIGAHTNLAVFLMSNPQLKKNVEHIYVMGGGIRANNPDCCRGKPSLTCQPALCSDLGNMYTAFATNPYAEYNIFGDPFAAYQVLHSGIPVTLIPLDATNTIPITKNFLHALEHNQRTYEAQYCFKSLHMARDTWFNDQFYQSYFMWDSFTAGVAASIMSNNNPCGKNEFADMEYMNITVITSNEPYGVSDGSNPFFDGQQTPRFHLKRGGVHSGHVQTGLEDPFCLVEHGRGRCEDGYTKEVVGSEAVRVLVAMRAKPNRDPRSQFNTEFLNSFLEVINRPQQSGRFNITTQFPYHKQILYKPNFGSRKLGKPVVFDMDMDAGDFLALFYLLKVPVEELDLKAVFVTPTGWASAATIDVVYDLLHMMGRDDIPVGLGDFFAMNQSSSGSAVGDCKYSKAIPLGSGGLLDSDTLYGLARNLPKSPRRYTAENSLRYGAPRNTQHPEFRQPQALDIWEKIKRTEDPKTKFTILTSGPLTTLAKIVLSDKDASSFIQDVFIVGGNVDYATERSGNTFSIDSNSYAELNMFLDPVAAKSVFESELNITLIPLGVQRKVNSFTEVMNKLYETKKTPEVRFAKRLLSRLQHLQKQNHRYQHMDIFLGQILGPVILAEEKSLLSSEFKVKPISIIAVGNESVDGQMEIDETNGKRVKVIEEVDQTAYYGSFASRLGDEKQSAVLGSFSLQKKLWSTPRRHPTKE